MMVNPVCEPGLSKEELNMAIPNSEDRDTTRFDHYSPLQVQDLKSGEIYEARMLNYSKGGIFFESDRVFKKGAQIYICIQNSPYTHSAGFLEYLHGEVLWRKTLKRSFFYYGYGIQLVSGSGNQKLDSNAARKGEDSRKHPRKPFFRDIGFRTRKGIHEGRSKNISASGLFIATEEKFEVGQLIKLNLPFKSKTARVLGQIAWVNEEGFGLKFVKLK